MLGWRLLVRGRGKWQKGDSRLEEYSTFHMFRVDGCDTAGKKLRMYTCYQLVHRHAMNMQKKL